MSKRTEYTKPNGTKILLNDRPEVVEYAESMGYTRTGAAPAAAPEPVAPTPIAAPEPVAATTPDAPVAVAGPSTRRQRAVRPVAG